jgi:hypothetical protein
MLKVQNPVDDGRHKITTRQTGANKEWFAELTNRSQLNRKLLNPPSSTLPTHHAEEHVMFTASPGALTR